MSSGYDLGRRVEYAVIHDLIQNGYKHVRGASSKGFADIVAVKPGQLLFVNVKRTTPPGPAEREALLDSAACLPGIVTPLVALGPASKLTYRRLTGVGARAWEPWTPDFEGAPA